MASMDEQILRATKEIVVKFIENGRISPAGFPENFKNIYRAVNDTIKGKPKSSASEKKTGT
jgi:predicted transcriptional regulator